MSLTAFQDVNKAGYISIFSMFLHRTDLRVSAVSYLAALSGVVVLVTGKTNWTSGHGISLPREQSA